MFERFTEKSIKVIMLAQEESVRLGHNFIGTEMILLGLIGEGTGVAAKTLKHLGLTLKDARIEAEKIIGRGSGFVANNIPWTPRVKHVLELTWDIARELGCNYISTEHLLLGLIRENEGVAIRVLENLGVNIATIGPTVAVILAQDVIVTNKVAADTPAYLTITQRILDKQLAWDKTYMAMARLVAQHSHDPKYKVAALVVNDQNGSVVGLGYNGRGKGRPNERLSMETGQSGWVHAEMNCLSRVSWEMACTYTLYTTLSPCFVCAGLILNNPIKRVVYGEAYPGDTGLQEIIAGLGESNVVCCPNH